MGNKTSDCILHNIIIIMVFIFTVIGYGAKTITKFTGNKKYLQNVFQFFCQAISSFVSYQYFFKHLISSSYPWLFQYL